jgi:hypothetical protein
VFHREACELGEVDQAFVWRGEAVGEAAEVFFYRLLWQAMQAVERLGTSVAA